MGLRLGMSVGDLAAVRAQTVADLWELTYPAAGGGGTAREATQADIDALFGF